MVANANTAVFPAIATKFILRHGSPPLGLDVMDMCVPALIDVGDGLTNVVTVFDDGVAGFNGVEGEFVADGHIVQDLDGDGFIRVHHPTGQILAGFDFLNDNHADGIGGLMYEELDH